MAVQPVTSLRTCVSLVRHVQQANSMTRRGSQAWQIAKHVPKVFYREEVAGKSLNDCDACSPGRYNSNTGATLVGHCLACDLGLFQMSEGKDHCNDCPSGWHGPVVGQPNCTQCPLGWISAVEGQESCHQCDVGEYEESREKCKLCPAGYAHSEPGRDSCPQCLAGRFVAGQGGV